MGRRSRKSPVFKPDRLETAAREDIELRWRDALLDRSDLVSAVTAAGAQREPYHRWLRLRQGFSPKLVRDYLIGVRRDPMHATRRPFFDPFSGTGTSVTEWARCDVPGIGAEIISSLVFLTNIRSAREIPPLPSLPFGPDATWNDLADQLTEPTHRAALMLAVAAQHTTSGRSDRGAKDIHGTLVRIDQMMREDLRTPLPRFNPVFQSDARSTAWIEGDSIAGILTSPPYLSRHDYPRITEPMDNVLRAWGAGNVESAPRRGQIPSSPRSVRRKAGDSIHPAVAEIGRLLSSIGEVRWSEVAASYFEDLAAVLRDWHRVMRPGAVAWVVIGGARPVDVYVPSDLILAELGEGAGFRVESVCVVRDLVPPARKFGRIGHVAPRESVVVLRKP